MRILWDPMPLTVIFAGVRPSLMASVQAVLPSIAAVPCGDGQAVISAASTGPVDLLVLDQSLANPPALALLSWLRLGLGLSDLPVIFCLPARARLQLPARLTGPLHVTRTILHPMQPRALAAAVAEVLNVPLAAPSLQAPPLPSLDESLQKLWEKARVTALERVDALEQAILLLMERRLSQDAQREAERHAHKLAGLVGTFGYHEGTRLARAMEGLLAQDPPHASAALLLSNDVVALRAELARPLTRADAPEEVCDVRPGLLVATADDTLAAALMAEGESRLLLCRRVRDGREALDQAFDVLLLDVAGDATAADVLAWCQHQVPPRPVVVLTDLHSFTDRVEFAQLGVRGVLQKPQRAPQVLDAVEQVLTANPHRPPVVLATDDDPDVLAAVQRILERQGLQVVREENAERFWEALETVMPDLLMLDVDMPGVNGLEICRALRSDRRFAMLPVVFLTALRDADVVSLVYQAGADDLISKPFAPDELAVRVVSRLERYRLIHALSTSDALTGLVNHPRSLHQIELHMQSGPLSLALIKLDHLANLNDTWGHRVGDAVLARFGAFLSETLPVTDVVARWGGAEFAVGMPSTRRHEAGERMADLLASLAREVFELPGASLSISASIGLASTPEDGTGFAELRRAAASALTLAQQDGGNQVRAACADEEAIDVLLVDDDEALAGVLVHALRQRAYRVRWVADGEEAVAGLLSDMHPRLMLLDVDLPGLDGLTILRRLADSGGLRRTRVIMLTARSLEIEVVRAMELGAFDHIAKPFSIPILLQRVRRALTG